MNTTEKENFLRAEMFEQLDAIDENATPAWGKMNAWQMVEHLTSFFDVSSGKLEYQLHVPEEHLPKYREFLYSDKFFRENTKAPASVIGEEPLPVSLPSYDAAKVHLKASVNAFFDHFKNKDSRTTHPVFGPLNYDEWIMLHYKHVLHHFRQFTAQL